MSKSDEISISIAMATYNGESYLEEQLDSLLKQTHQPSELVVCDDGSTDRTIEIIKRFAQLSLFPVRLYLNTTRLGYADNFLKAATLCQGNWIAFCDQDDVWLDNKIKDTYDAILSDLRPVMILQNAYICDRNLNHQGRLFPKTLTSGYHAPLSQYGFWVWPGFLKTVRSDIFKVGAGLERPRSYFAVDGKQTHDKWTCMIANSTGGFLVVDKAAALYRRHPKALTGTYDRQDLIEKIKKSANVSSDHYSYLSSVATETALYLAEVAKHELQLNRRDFLNASGVFKKIAQIQLERSKLYKTNDIISRIQCLWKILILGGYLGRRSFSMDSKSAFKDVFYALSVFNITGLQR